MCRFIQAPGRVRPPQFPEVCKVINCLNLILFPGYRGPMVSDPEFRSFVCRQVSDLQRKLARLIRRALAFQDSALSNRAGTGTFRAAAERLVIRFFDQIPDVRTILNADVKAAYEKDPALSKGDHHLVPLAYPGLYAISIYRMAHELHVLEVPYIPRMMTELAHRRTGIDIHPGARIGRGFFIDHGTGVVIGETAIIDNDVTLYQGVTIGSLNFPQDAAGNLIRGAKRHPTMRGGTTVFANAAVLGNIEVGHRSLIGANVSLRRSVGPESIVRVPSKQREISISGPSVENVTDEP